MTVGLRDCVLVIAASSPICRGTRVFRLAAVAAAAAATSALRCSEAPLKHQVDHRAKTNSTHSQHVSYVRGIVYTYYSSTVLHTDM